MSFDKIIVKERGDIISVIDSLGLARKKVGSKISILCPVHDDKHFGSCFINPEWGTWKCYACGESGDFLKLYQAVKGCSFNDAVNQTAKICGISESENKESECERLHIIPKDKAALIGMQSGTIYGRKQVIPASSMEERPDDSYKVERDAIGTICGFSKEQLIVQNALAELFKQNEAAYHDLVERFCKKTKSFYKNVKANAGNPVIVARLGISRKQIEECCNKILAEVTEISRDYGNGTIH